MLTPSSSCYTTTVATAASNAVTPDVPPEYHPRFSLLALVRSRIIGRQPLGAEQVYTDFGAHYSGYELSAITFASDGSLFIGTNAPPGIVVVHPGGIYETYDPRPCAHAAHRVCMGDRYNALHEPGRERAGVAGLHCGSDRRALLRAAPAVVHEL